MPSGVPAHTDNRPVRVHHIVVDAHDLPGLARFFTQAPGRKVLPGREREIVIGTDQNAAAGMCFMPVTDPKRVKGRVHLDLRAALCENGAGARIAAMTMREIADSLSSPASRSASHRARTCADVTVITSGPGLARLPRTAGPT